MRSFRVVIALVVALAWADRSLAQAVFDQLLVTGNSKTAETSFVLSPSAKTVTSGKTIFVAFAADDAGSGFTINDNLGNSYGLVREVVLASNVKTQLWRAPVTSGGSITSITIAWTSNITAKAAVAAEFSNFGSLRTVGGVTGTGVNTRALGGGLAAFTNELWVGAFGVEDNEGYSSVAMTGLVPAQTGVLVGTDGTTGAGAASNIWCALGYSLITADSTTSGAMDGAHIGGALDNAGAGAVYDPAGAGPSVPAGTLGLLGVGR